MTIKVLYAEKDFFNNTVQMEAECRDPKIGNIKKAFAYLKKNYAAAILTKNYSFYYDSFSDFENGIITIVCYKGTFDKDIARMSTKKAKKIFYSIFETVEK